MSDIPKCTSWRGHKFEGRYSVEPTTDVKFSDYDVPQMTESLFLDLAKMRQKRTYERDVCVRCGATIERSPRP